MTLLKIYIERNFILTSLFNVQKSLFDRFQQLFFLICILDDASIWSASSLFQRFEIDPRMKIQKTMGSYQIPSIQARYSSNSNRPSNGKMENHEPLSNSPQMGPFQASYVACRPRVFGPKARLSPRAPFVLSICIGLSGEKFCQRRKSKRGKLVRCAITQHRRYVIKSMRLIDDYFVAF